MRITLVVLMVLFAPATWAQTTDLEISPICTVSGELGSWINSNVNQGLDEYYMTLLQNARGDLRDVCENEPTSAQFKEGSHDVAIWLTKADAAAQSFTTSVAMLTVVEPFTARSKKRIQEALLIVIKFQSVLNGYRTLAYSMLAFSNANPPATSPR